MAGFDISKYRDMFLEEAEELFESADSVLLAAEANGALTDDEMGQLFRDVHTLKGSGASVELAYFAEFTHDVENLMDKLRNKEIELIPEMVETLLDGLDVMREILDLENSDAMDRDKFTELSSELLITIRAYSSGQAVVATPVQETVVAKEITVEKDNSLEILDSDDFGFFDMEDENKLVGSFGFFCDEKEESVLDGDIQTNNTPEVNLTLDDSNDIGFFGDDEAPAIIEESKPKQEEVKAAPVVSPVTTETPVAVTPAVKKTVAKKATAKKPAAKKEEAPAKKTAAKKPAAKKAIPKKPKTATTKATAKKDDASKEDK